MTTSNEIHDASRSEHNARRKKVISRKVRAILAGGLVLGVGAVITLATWNDSEFAKEVFGTDGFDIESSLDGSTFTQNESPSTAATLNFSVPATSLAPGDVAYAPFAVRVAGPSGLSGIVVVTAGTSSTFVGLTYTLVHTTNFVCNATTVAAAVAASATNVLVPVGTPVGTVPGSPSFVVLHGVAPDAGPAINLCIVVTAGTDLGQFQSGSVILDFAAHTS